MLKTFLSEISESSGDGITTATDKSSGGGITTDFFYNIHLVCNFDFQNSSAIDDIRSRLNSNPCLSAVAFTTLLIIDGLYPVSQNFEVQSSHLQWLTDQILVDYKEVLGREEKRNMDECATADIDFEFIIDSSGSVGDHNWRKTMELIAKYWIEGAIRPNGSPECGNHVAARSYSVWFLPENHLITVMGEPLSVFIIPVNREIGQFRPTL